MRLDFSRRELFSGKKCDDWFELISCFWARWNTPPYSTWSNKCKKRWHVEYAHRFDWKLYNFFFGKWKAHSVFSRIYHAEDNCTNTNWSMFSTIGSFFTNILHTNPLYSVLSVEISRECPGMHWCDSIQYRR